MYSLTYFSLYIHVSIAPLSAVELQAPGPLIAKAHKAQKAGIPTAGLGWTLFLEPSIPKGSSYGATMELIPEIIP